MTGQNSRTAFQWSAGETWQEEAACRTLDPKVGDALFFPIGAGNLGRKPPEDPYTEARAICRRCPVRAACLDFALATGQDYGMWGGADEWERRAIRRRRGARS